jgi:hypothetical protein
LNDKETKNEESKTAFITAETLASKTLETNQTASFPDSHAPKSSETPGARSQASGADENQDRQTEKPQGSSKVETLGLALGADPAELEGSIGPSEENGRPIDRYLKEFDDYSPSKSDLKDIIDILNSGDDQVKNVVATNPFQDGSMVDSQKFNFEINALGLYCSKAPIVICGQDTPKTEIAEPEKTE